MERFDDAWKKEAWERSGNVMQGVPKSRNFLQFLEQENAVLHTHVLNRAILHRLINNPKISDAELKAFFESKKIKPTSRWFGETTSALLHAKRSKEFAGYGLKGISSQIPAWFKNRQNRVTRPHFGMTIRFLKQPDIREVTRRGFKLPVEAA